MNSNHTPVLIIGAGPTGLMAACQLALRDIPFRIIEKSEHASSKSKAIVLQARSLEILSQMGIVDTFINEGQKTQKIQMFSRGKLRQEISLGNFEEVSTPFPFINFIGQDKTEGLLIDFLNIKNIVPEWNTELVDLNQTDQKAIATVLSNGEKETITADWIIGADGAHSKVRHSMSTKFSGGKYPNGFMLSDVDIDWDYNEPALKLLLSNNVFGIFFPLGKKQYRVITLIPKEMSKKENPNFDDLKNFVENEFDIPMKISNPRWTSFYNIHHRCVDFFREGRFLLAGDAAHIHSPAGGQGMNTGLQDAYNLCWKLALVIQDKAGDNLLNSYQKERLPVARNLVNGTDRLFSTMTSTNPFFTFMRARVFPLMLGFGLNTFGMQSLVFRFISQTSINYQKRYPHYNLAKGITIKAGDRIKNVQLNTGLLRADDLHGLLIGNGFHLLIFGKKSDFDPQKINSFINNFPCEITPHWISPEHKDCFSKFNIQEKALILVRPDLHVGITADNTADLEKYLPEFV